MKDTRGGQVKDSTSQEKLLYKIGAVIGVVILIFVIFVFLQLAKTASSDVKQRQEEYQKCLETKLQSPDSANIHCVPPGMQDNMKYKMPKYNSNSMYY